LINNGADAGKQNKKMFTALHAAVKRTSVTQCLLEALPVYLPSALPTRACKSMSMSLQALACSDPP
jgi:hypothetical protein